MKIVTKRIFQFVPDELSVGPSGRHLPPSEEEIKKLAADISIRGQMSPILLKDGEDESPQVLSGHIRIRAVQMLRRGFHHHQHWFHHPNLKIQCRFVVTDGREETPFQSV